MCVTVSFCRGTAGVGAYWYSVSFREQSCDTLSESLATHAPRVSWFAAGRTCRGTAGV